MNLFVAYTGPNNASGNLVIEDLAGETIETITDIRKIRDYIHKSCNFKFPKEHIIITNFIWLPVTENKE